MTIIEFLLARIAEDETKIAAMTGEARRVKQAPIFQQNPADWLTSVDIFVSPARWVAECEAKRRIVEMHPCDDCGAGDDPCRTLRALAAVYADHPDYDEAWRP